MCVCVLRGGTIQESRIWEGINFYSTSGTHGDDDDDDDDDELMLNVLRCHLTY